MDSRWIRASVRPHDKACQQFCSGTHLNHAIDFANVVVDRVTADLKATRDFLLSAPVKKQIKYTAFRSGKGKFVEPRWNRVQSAIGAARFKIPVVLVDVYAVDVDDK